MTFLVRSHLLMASCFRGLELNDLYSLFDEVFDVPFGYVIPRDRVVVIPDSQYNKLRAQENERQVGRLEARKEHH